MKMNNIKFEKLNKISKNTKIVGLVVIILTVGVIGFNLIRSAFASPSESYLADQTVSNLEFKNATLNYANNVSTYEVDVTNTTSSKYTLKTITIKFLDADSNEIETLTGYVGDFIDANDSKVLTASVDKEIKDVASITYTVNK